MVYMGLGVPEGVHGCIFRKAAVMDPGLLKAWVAMKALNSNGQNMDIYIYIVNIVWLWNYGILS